MVSLMRKAKIRLYVEQPLADGQSLTLSRDQAHYLFGVMRQRVGGQILVFNGRDGEYLAEIVEAGKRSGVLYCRQQTRVLQMPPDLWLLFAPIKKVRTDFIVEKAAELGVARIFPVQTRFTNSDRVRQDRLQAHVIEATEQCGGTFVPPVEDLQPLDKLLEKWPQDRQVVFCDESLVGCKANLIATSDIQKWAILVGPEGGFSDEERKRLAHLPYVTTISLGPRILRADTAAVAALALWHSTLGDW